LSWEKRKEKMKAELCEIIVKIGALKFGAFTLSSGILSPYYIDLRIVPSFPDAYQKVENIFSEMAKNDVGLDKFKRIAGIPTAGVPFASVLAYNLSKPFLYVRKEEKTHGRERRVEGMLHPGDKVLLVDDLITKGTNLVNATEAVKAEGGVIEDVLVLIDREEGGKKTLNKLGISLHSLMQMSEAAKILCDMEAITKEELQAILKQIKK